mmetsp:Transcript_56095/g.122665  ORF Transcript_56095/g.122665 Transcript_56095/m.122665 type:complete len:222 (-) Transcript_56095:517-1182(-)
MTLEAIVVKGFNALAGILMALEVHEGITHIRHGALVQGAVEEVKGTGKAQVLQLRDQLPLGVAIRDVADHQGGHLLLLALVLLLQVHVSGHPVVAAVPWQVALVLVHAPLAVHHVFCELWRWRRSRESRTHHAFTRRRILPPTVPPLTLVVGIVGLACKVMIAFGFPLCCFMVLAIRPCRMPRIWAIRLFFDVHGHLHSFLFELIRLGADRSIRCVIRACP